MARLYGEKENIDSKKVKNFFDERAKKEINKLSMTTFQNEKIAEKRYNEEFKLISDNIDLNNKIIFEIGCGIGKWGELFSPYCKKYLGIDYSKNLIELAKKNNSNHNCIFQEMSATNLKIEELLVKPPYDIIFITGVLMYLNDEDIKTLFEEMSKISFKNTLIYIRETVSNMSIRLTLKDYYSNELNDEYNVIYRTDNEILNFIKVLNPKHVEINEIHTTTNKRSETGFKNFIISL